MLNYIFIQIHTTHEHVYLVGLVVGGVVIGEGMTEEKEEEGVVSLEMAKVGRMVAQEEVRVRYPLQEVLQERGAE